MSGWICKQVTVERGQFATQTEQDVYDLMCVFRDAILSAGIWSLDTDIHTGEAAGVPIQVDSTNYIWTHGLYFVNAAGAKLSVTYTWSGSSYPLNNKHLNDTSRSSMGGLAISMIPPGCGSFSPTNIRSTDLYSPAYATPPVAMCGRNGVGGGSSSGGASDSDSVLKYMAVRATTAGWCRWSFLMKGNVLIVFLRNSWEGQDRCTMMTCGEIVGECVNSSDNGVGTRYGCFSTGATNYEAANRTDSYDGGGNIRCDKDKFMKTGMNSCGYATFRGCFRAAEYSNANRDHETDGMWKSARHCYVQGGLAAMHNSVWLHDWGVSGNVVSWPLLVGWGNSGCQCVPGTGIKGYLDPEIFRGTVNDIIRGQKVEGGSFVYVGGGLLVAWDDELNPGISLF